MIYKCKLCDKVEVERLDVYCPDCRDFIFKGIEDERKGLVECNPKLNKEYGSITALRFLPFWFSLGYTKENYIFFGGNCQNWSNAFKCSPTDFKAVFEVLNWYDTFTPEQQRSIKKGLKMYPNKLFLCKDRDTLILEWHYYPDYDPNRQQIINYTNLKGCPELKQIKD